MTAVSAPRPGWELLAGQVNQRRYEALRAYLYEGASLQQAAGRAGYTRAALASLVRGRGRLPSHQDDPRRQLPAVPAGPQAHRHPPRQPRR
jgi:hypothetical protein